MAVEDAGGEPLSRLMDRAPLDVDEALEILHQAAEGLRAAHRRDVVQGHLKPSDILLTTDEMGRRLVKVAFIDMGVSAQESLAPVFGELLGNPKYMAPEVVRGRLASPESDVFALGVIAYEMLTGKEPFPSDNAVGYLFANCEAHAVPADQVREGLPHEVALVLARMLEKEPSRRYRNMQRLTDDLDRCVTSMKTGKVEVVPYGTDSAFARGYEMTPPPALAGSAAPAAGARRVSLGSRVLFYAATLVALAGLYYLAVNSGLLSGGTAAGSPQRSPFTPRALVQASTPEPPQPGPAAIEQPAPPQQQAVQPPEQPAQPAVTQQPAGAPGRPGAGRPAKGTGGLGAEPTAARL